MASPYHAWDWASHASTSVDRPSTRAEVCAMRLRVDSA